MNTLFNIIIILLNPKNIYLYGNETQGDGKKAWMVVTKTKIPTYTNIREVIYRGPEFQTKDFPAKLELKEPEARHYF